MSKIIKPTDAIVNERKQTDHTVLTIDTRRAEWRGIPWRSLGGFGKRKFENAIVLSRPKERLLFHYVI